MAITDHVDLSVFMEGVKKRNPGHLEFVKVNQYVTQDIYQFIAGKQEYHHYQILRRIAAPDRIISFRVCREDDNSEIRVQRGWRVQNNSAVGPYKGGIRFHPSVTESVLKLLAFEQTFKNALTGLPMGESDARALIANGCIAVAEDANIAGFKKVADAMLAFRGALNLPDHRRARRLRGGK